MAQKESQAVATAQLLTGSYVVANTKASFPIDGESSAEIYLSYTTGAAETNNTLDVKLEFAYDDASVSDASAHWFQQSLDTISSGVNTLGDLALAVAGASAETEYKKIYRIPLAGKRMRISFKETGVAAAFGTVSANIVMGPIGQSYNHQSTQVSVSLDEFPAAAVLTDNFATPTTTQVGAFGMVYDGAAWDFMRGSAADGVSVNLGAINDVTVTSGTVTIGAALPAGTNALGSIISTAGTATLSNVASSASSVVLLASNSSREGMMVHNDSTQILYLKLGATASTSSYTVQIPANGYYELPIFNNRVYRGTIDGIWASANGNARVTELT